MAEPFSPAGNHITVISGSLAPESALIKLSGKLMKTFEGPAQCYDGEQAAFEVRCVLFLVYRTLRDANPEGGMISLSDCS